MRILIHSINYAPELTGIGKYNGEMAEWLAANGHEVRVVTAHPYYPSWCVQSGYDGGRYRCEIRNGVRVWRCPLWVPAQPSGWKRLIHLAGFALSALPVMLMQIFWRPDVVLVLEPPLFCSPAAWLVARLCGAGCWLHIQDYEVDAAYAMGLLKSKGVHNLVNRVERMLLQGFDRVSSLSGRMLDKALDKGVKPERLIPFPNWVDIEAISPVSGGNAYRKQLNLPEDAVVALYSGNMGNKQGLELLAAAAGMLDGRTDIFFVFCGNGSGRAALVEGCSGLARVRFLELQPVERLNELLGLADMHLLPQRADAADLVMPSKLTGMLASAKPVIATADSGTELGIVVSNAGIIVEPGDAAGFARAIAALADEPEQRRRLGEAGRAYALRYLDKAVVLERFEQDLKLAANR
ncbi:glycosyltransferase WbuB [Candidatus Methylospira mobilis]|uniref:Glycosyltransferase WbuB n=1 Tax=Candidatus Methylospira mobilis TaxID=1808979 RepID=A0A5Q0BK47_9GAMM|nr:glycosyltransferase WbuB [Candidatus Methylospira mobilis]QFY42176.1 glycosyltransferase WbuB [Candidatus Methylospira mobilis]WNV03191.1 glycosyltransferase WbuB [Candidatus Methylospira mobilis]